VTEPGPVSAHLEADLREQARQHGILVWLDKEGTYTEFADGLGRRADATAFPFPVRRFRGSYLELLLGLEDLEDGVGMTPLIVHVPGHTEDTIAETPLFELYRAGRRYRRALPTLVREAAIGRATPAAIERFLEWDDVSVAHADTWLAGLEIDAQDGGGPDLSALGPEALFDALTSGGQPGGHSLAAVCRREFDKVLDKSQQISDWTRRPLTGAQVNYAALDVEILVDLFAKFSEIQPALLVT
jgi:hypothetical protein